MFFVDKSKKTKVACWLVLIGLLVVLIPAFLSFTGGASKNFYLHGLFYDDRTQLVDDLVDEINKQKGYKNESDFTKAYGSLVNLLKLNNIELGDISQAMEFNQELSAFTLGDVIVISTRNQYKINGFVIFIDASTGRIISQDRDFALGVVDIKVIQKSGALPGDIVIAKYITASGTGLYADSVRMYYVEGREITTSFDRPYSEHNSVLGEMYTNVGVEFKSRNDIVINNGTVEIHTSGVVVIYREQVEYRPLPKEIYTLDVSERHFIQIGKVKKIKGKTIADMYSDVIDAANGIWLKKPQRLKSGEIKDIYKEEIW